MTLSKGLWDLDAHAQSDLENVRVVYFAMCAETDYLLGMVLDFTPLSLILMPIVIPLGKAAGIDLIYFGVVFTIAGALGMLTPPVGNVLNVVAGVGRVRLDRIMVGVLPFLFAEIAVLLLLVLFPQIITVPLGLLR